MRLRAQNSDLSKVEIKKLNRQLRPLIAVLVVMVLSLLVMLGVLSLPHLFPWMMERMGEGGALQGASSVRRLLECCRIWYMLLLGTGVQSYWPWRYASFLYFGVSSGLSAGSCPTTGT